MLDALREVQVAGVATNLELLERIVGSSNFQTGPLQTGLLAGSRERGVDCGLFPCHDLALGVLGRRPAAGSIPAHPGMCETVFASTLGVTCCSRWSGAISGARYGVKCYLLAKWFSHR